MNSRKNMLCTQGMKWVEAARQSHFLFFFFFFLYIFNSPRSGNLNLDHLYQKLKKKKKLKKRCTMTGTVIQRWTLGCRLGLAWIVTIWPNLTPLIPLRNQEWTNWIWMGVLSFIKEKWQVIWLNSEVSNPGEKNEL